MDYRSNSLASNTDESYNPDVGSETESRASERIHSAEIGRYSSWVKAEVDVNRTNTACMPCLSRPDSPSCLSRGHAW